MACGRVLWFLAIGCLITALMLDGVEARRKVLRGRKTVTRRYYWGTAIPAWSIVVLVGIAMLLTGAGLFGILEKFVVSSIDFSDRTASYHQPVLQSDP